MSKYAGLSGKGGTLTVTPYGMLLNIIMYSKVKIYLYVVDKNTIQYSLDKISWEELNKKLGLELLDMSNYCENIVVLADNKEVLENDK